MFSEKRPIIERTCELLSPAGSPDAGYAAFQYGADAVYCGLKKFSARAEADNFTLDELDQLTAYAHSLPGRRRVFVTLNTVILQRELPELIEQLATLADIAVDGLIVQDLGVASIVRRHFPALRLHASTQIAVHNRAGAEVLKTLGFARVVLARELTLDEIRSVCDLGGLEVEVFVHGALCYCYSGLCLFSSHILGRSGNRGRCAYPCRDYFTCAPCASGSPPSGHAFSLKDLALPDDLPRLQEAGVHSLKIEGRKKSPLYVATTTAYYRTLLDDRLSDTERGQREAELKAVFSRPWTRLYLDSRHNQTAGDRDTVGHRGTPIGTIEAVLPGRPPRLRFTTHRRLELHDGLQVDLPGVPYGFAVDKLRLPDAPASGPVFQAPAGALIEVPLPDDHPPLPLGATVYCSSSQEVKQRYRFTRPKANLFRLRQIIDVTLDLNAAELRALAAVVHDTSTPAEAIEVSQSLPGPFSRAKDAEGMAAAARTAFEKLGDTRFVLHRFTWRNPHGCFVPVSRLNALRREITAKIEAQLTLAQAARIRSVQAAVCAPPQDECDARHSAFRVPRSEFQRWSIRVDRCEWLDAFEEKDWKNCDEISVSLDGTALSGLTSALPALAARVGTARIRLSLPAITRAWEQQTLNEKLAALHALGFNRWEAANLSAWRLIPVAPGAVSDIACDWTVYVFNRAAALQALELGASRFTLSPEDGLDNMRALLTEFGAAATVIVYQDTPLFISESCAHATLQGACEGPDRCRFTSLQLRSSFGQSVTVLNRRCRTVVINNSPFSLGGRLRDLAAAGAQRLRADFIYRPYDALTVRSIWRSLRAGQAPQGSHVANFDRGLL